MPNGKNLVWFAVGVVFAMFVWPWLQTRLSAFKK